MNIAKGDTKRRWKKCLPRRGLWALGGEGNSVEDTLARGGNTTWAPRVAHVVTQMTLSCHSCHHRCHRIAVVCRSVGAFGARFGGAWKIGLRTMCVILYKQQGWEGKMHEIYWNILKYDVMLRESSAKIMDIEVLKRFDYNTKLGFDGELWLCLYVFFLLFKLSLPIGVSHKVQNVKATFQISSDSFGSVWDPKHFVNAFSGRALYVFTTAYLCCSLCRGRLRVRTFKSVYTKVNNRMKRIEVLWRNYCMVNTYVYVLYVVYMFV